MVGLSTISYVPSSVFWGGFRLILLKEAPTSISSPPPTGRPQGTIRAKEGSGEAGQPQGTIRAKEGSGEAGQPQGIAPTLVRLRLGG